MIASCNFSVFSTRRPTVGRLVTDAVSHPGQQAQAVSILHTLMTRQPPQPPPMLQHQLHLPPQPQHQPVAAVTSAANADGRTAPLVLASLAALLLESPASLVVESSWRAYLTLVSRMQAAGLITAGEVLRGVALDALWHLGFGYPNAFSNRDNDEAPLWSRRKTADELASWTDAPVADTPGNTEGHGMASARGGPPPVLSGIRSLQLQVALRLTLQLLESPSSASGGDAVGREDFVTEIPTATGPQPSPPLGGTTAPLGNGLDVEQVAAAAAAACHVMDYLDMSGHNQGALNRVASDLAEQALEAAVGALSAYVRSIAVSVCYPDNPAPIQMLEQRQQNKQQQQNQQQQAPLQLQQQRQQMSEIDDESTIRSQLNAQTLIKCTRLLQMLRGLMQSTLWRHWLPLLPVVQVLEEVLAAHTGQFQLSGKRKSRLVPPSLRRLHSWSSGSVLASSTISAVGAGSSTDRAPPQILQDRAAVITDLLHLAASSDANAMLLWAKHPTAEPSSLHSNSQQHTPAAVAEDDRLPSGSTAMVAQEAAVEAEGSHIRSSGTGSSIELPGLGAGSIAQDLFAALSSCASCLAIPSDPVLLPVLLLCIGRQLPFVTGTAARRLLAAGAPSLLARLSWSPDMVLALLQDATKPPTAWSSNVAAQSGGASHHGGLKGRRLPTPYRNLLLSAAPGSGSGSSGGGECLPLGVVTVLAACRGLEVFLNRGRWCRTFPHSRQRAAERALQHISAFVRQLLETAVDDADVGGDSCDIRGVERQLGTLQLRLAPECGVAYRAALPPVQWIALCCLSSLGRMAAVLAAAQYNIRVLQPLLLHLVHAAMAPPKSVPQPPPVFPTLPSADDVKRVIDDFLSASSLRPVLLATVAQVTRASSSTCTR